MLQHGRIEKRAAGRGKNLISKEGIFNYQSGLK